MSGTENDPDVLARLAHIEALLALLVERQAVRDFYEIEEFARAVGKAVFTVRSWARERRIRAEKKLSGRGARTRGANSGPSSNRVAWATAE